MEYETLKDEITNTATLTGRICSTPTLSHQVEGESFYEFKMEVNRLSQSSDIIPVTISERSVLGIELKEGNFFKLVGEYRSYNKLLSEKSKLILHFFAKEIETANAGEYENEVKLIGFLCKEPIYRKTPFNREICDILLAVNRTNYHKSDYIPCILWGRNARFVANQNIGCKIEIVGRIQSREYTKTLPDGEAENKTAYEVSCQRVSILSNISNFKLEEEQQQSDAVNN
jgi:single-stranded DNA-binding protein